MSRSRGGLTTEIHALVDADGMPIVLRLTAGQARDGRSAQDMFDPPFSAFLHRYRDLVERFFHRPEHFRAEATRYDTRHDNFLPSVPLASVRIWLRHDASMT